MKANEIRLVDRIIAHPGSTLTQLVQLTGIPQTTVHRALSNLCKHKLLLKQSEGYFLGPLLLRWINSSSLDQNERYAQVIHPYLVELAQATGETVHLVQREGFEAFYIDKVESSGPIMLKSSIGNKLQLYCTGAGRALLTLFTPEELKLYWQTVERVASTPKTQTDTQVLAREIEYFYEQGFAMEVEQDQLTIQCLGAPIDLGSIQLAISITTTTLLHSQNFLQFAKLLQGIVQKIKAEF